MIVYLLLNIGKKQDNLSRHTAKVARATHNSTGTELVVPLSPKISMRPSTFGALLSIETRKISIMRTLAQNCRAGYGTCPTSRCGFFVQKKSRYCAVRGTAASETHGTVPDGAVQSTTLWRCHGTVRFFFYKSRYGAVLFFMSWCGAVRCIVRTFFLRRGLADLVATTAVHRVRNRGVGQ